MPLSKAALARLRSSDSAMPTPSGHTTAILASKVRGTPVYNTDGERIGTVEDVVLDKMSNNIMFAVLGSGGVLGMGEKFRPIPWPILDYDGDRGGYIVPVARDVIENAPSYRMEDLTSDDGEQAIRADRHGRAGLDPRTERTRTIEALVPEPIGAERRGHRSLLTKYVVASR